MSFPKGFPFGKGVWIWELKNCLNGDIDAIIAKMKEYDLQYAIVKAGDGKDTWDYQFTKDLVDRFHTQQLKILSWSYIYGVDPVREADIASWALNLGADGHVFDAESEYEQLSNPSQAAETMLQALRALNPDAFLAHAPFPIIDYHQRFPYATFGKYCDAVMPQVYQGDFRMSSADAINWMFTQWSKWEATAPKESVKPIIPIAQAYDNYQLTPAYILKPQDITDFVTAAAGYKSVNFYEFSHILRDDCWGAIRDARVTPPTSEDLGVSTGQNTQSTETSTSTPTPPAPISQQTASSSAENQTVTSPTPPATEQTQTASANLEANPTKLPQDTPIVTQKTIPVPSTVKVTSSPSSPGGVKMTIVPHKPHIEYVREFIRWLFTKIKSVFSQGGGSK